jgi:hypothetical protein
MRVEPRSIAASYAFWGIRGIFILLNIGHLKKLPFWALGESFATEMRYEKAAIHKVFRLFHNFF